MPLELFLQFCACLLFALFSLYWQPRFTYPKYRWIPFVLVCLGVLGALLTVILVVL